MAITATHPTATANDNSKPLLAVGHNSPQLLAEATTLLDRQWMLDDSQQGIRKTFNFPTYAKALVQLF